MRISISKDVLSEDRIKGGSPPVTVGGFGSASDTYLMSLRVSGESKY